MPLNNGTDQDGDHNNRTAGDVEYEHPSCYCYCYQWNTGRPLTVKVCT
jgi:hypothetical protein